MTHSLAEITKLYQDTFYTTDAGSIALMAAILIGSRMKTPPVWLYLIGPSSGGKCLGGNVPVLMYDGQFKKAKDIKTGDILMGDDSTPRTVLTTTTGKENMYRIHQEHGDNYTVNESHILSLKYSSTRREYRGIGKGDTIDLPLKEYLNKKQSFKNQFKGYKVRVDFRPTKVKIDPYLLGLWLGDGTRITPNITNPDREIIKYLREFAQEHDFRLSEKSKNGCKTIRLCSDIHRFQQDSNKLKIDLKSYGLMPQKFVPQDYKTNTREVRFQVLAGLLDTDGYLSENRRFDFINKDKQLAEDVVFLARSLGFSSTIHKTTKGIKSRNFTGTYWRVNIGGNIHLIPTKVKRKQAKKRKHYRDELVSGLRVESLGIGNYYGFQVDGNGRFLLGDFTVTHNSLLIEAFAKVPFITQVSDLTPNTFLSGMSATSRETSLLKRLGINFTITMKDFTTILQKPEETQGAIVAQMREIYDGYFVKESGTGIRLEWGSKETEGKGHATFLMACTEAIFAVQDKFADMGTRATNYVLLDQERKEMTRRAMRNNSVLNVRLDHIQDVFRDFVMERVEALPPELPYVDETLESEIIEVADLSSLCRSVVKRDYRGVKNLALSAEMPPRIAKQMLSITQLLAYENEGVLTPELRATMFKTGFDSISKQRRIILETLASYPHANVSGLAEKIHYPPDRTREWLEDLQMFQVVEPFKIGKALFWKVKAEHQATLKKFCHLPTISRPLEGEEVDSVGAGNFEDVGYGETVVDNPDLTFETNQQLKDEEKATQAAFEDF